MHTPHRHRRRLPAVVALSALLLAGLPAAGHASPDAGSPPPAGPVAPGQNLRTDLDPGRYQVTLITGDQVRLNVSADRKVAVDVTAAPRADSGTPEVQWYTSGDGVYVMPEDARPHLDAGLLDWKLFDVEHLARNGFTDGAVDGLPLIVEYGGNRGPVTTMRAAGVAPDAADLLGSIGAAAVDVDQQETTALWESARDGWSAPDGGDRTRTAAPAVEKIWLDDMAELALDESVPQIGAPQAWDLGLDGRGVTVAVLDTGIDSSHPDLAGKVVAARNFIDPGEAPVDGHGHGTHVASTIAGGGAASGGDYTGVAPGADLVVGKVCGAEGCPVSAVIAGMEWAAREQDADVVNMSLGACCTDGTDPMSQAVNQLSAETGALFVTSAGNEGGTATVGTPAAADAALAVAAVDKSGEMAYFSSRGPRIGDDALKPEIAAPGVHIAAARAGGTALCENICVQPGDGPIDDNYAAASGTSMASPHVAGAAALLAQQRPGWDGTRLKAALVASTQDLGHTVYEQGAGLVDIARAVDQQVEVSPAVADFRFLRPDDPSRDQTLTYRNPTAEPVTLALTGALARTSGAAAPAGALTLDTGTLTVPAGGSASVTVHLDHSLLAVSRYTGSVVATAGDLRLTTPVGAVIGDQTARVTLNVTGLGCDDVHCRGDVSSFLFDGVTFHRYGDVAEATGGAAGPPPAPVRVPGPVDADDPSGTADIFLERGWYAVEWTPTWVDADSHRRQHASLWLPEVEVTGDMTLEMDAHRAVKVRHLPPQPVGEDGYAPTNRVFRYNGAGQGFAAGDLGIFGEGGHYWSYPTAPVTDGSFVLNHSDVLEAPQVAMTVTGTEPVRLHPLYSGYRSPVTRHWTVPVRFPEGTRTLPVVDLGDGEEEDYEGVDVAGKLVLIRLPVQPPTYAYERIRVDQLERARAAGAAGVLVPMETRARPIMIFGSPSFEDRPQIPYVAVSSADADLLTDRLQDGPVEVTVTGTPESPYTYYASAYTRGGVPESMDYHYPHDQLMRVDARFHATTEAPVHYDRTTYSSDEWVVHMYPHDIGVPSVRTQYFAPVGADFTHVRETQHTIHAEKPGPVIRRQEVFDGPGRTVERWNADPWVPGFLDADHIEGYPICVGCREGDMLLPYVRVTTGDPASQIGRNPVGWGRPPGDPWGPDPWAGLRVYRNGEPVPPEDALGFGSFPYYPMSTEEANYRVELDLTDNEDDSYTEWEFRSGAAAAHEQVPDPYFCAVGRVIGEPDLPCRVEPFLFLRYAGLDLNLRNQAPAPGAHRFEVGVYRQETTMPQPEVAGLKLWASYDGGGTWHEAKVKPQGDGRFDVKVVHPPATRRASDSVTLRAEAWDVGGNRVAQTLPEAYTLTHRDTLDCGGTSCGPPQ